jgi:hypothetical protein
MNPTNITEICKRFGKLPAHFKDNYADKSGFKIVKNGKKIHTEISEDLLIDFLQWLSFTEPKLRIMLATQGIEATLAFAKTYKKPVDK